MRNYIASKYLKIIGIGDEFKSPTLVFKEAQGIPHLNSRHMVPLKKSTEANNSLTMQMNTSELAWKKQVGEPKGSLAVKG